jgi:hypothetical protein
MIDLSASSHKWEAYQPLMRRCTRDHELSEICFDERAQS